MSEDWKIELSRIEAICSRREYAQKDIEEKLRLRNLDSQTIAKIINSLTENRFIDNGRYAGAFARDKIHLSGWGRRKTEFALKQKGISAEHISQAFDTIDKNLAQKRMIEVLTNKERQLRNELDLNKKREKLIKFALSRGYEYSQVNDLIRRMI